MSRGKWSGSLKQASLSAGEVTHRWGLQNRQRSTVKVPRTIQQGKQKRTSISAIEIEKSSSVGGERWKEETPLL